MRMPEKAFANTISAIYDAVLDERRWTEALKAVAEYVGAVDVGYLLANKKTGESLSVAWWGCFSGNSAEYLTHYCKIDPFRVAQESASCGSWNRASEILPRSLLSQDEWYNDFILKGGVCDILGAKLHEDASHVVLIGFQSPIGDSRSFPRNQTALRRLTEPLCQAARLHVGLQEIGYRSAIAEEALNELDAGVIVADGDGRVLRTNQLADAILSQGDGLAIRNGRLAAPRSFETARLARLIAGAANVVGASSGCMPIVPAAGGAPYVIRVAPIGAELAAFYQPVAMVIITVPADICASERELVELFGLSPAESRLAVALARGKRPPAIAEEFAIRITTVRTQLRSILTKLNVERQSDIVRLISRIPVWRSPKGRDR